MMPFQHHKLKVLYEGESFICHESKIPVLLTAHSSDGTRCIPSTKNSNSGEEMARSECDCVYIILNEIRISWGWERGHLGLLMYLEGKPSISHSKHISRLQS